MKCEQHVKRDWLQAKTHYANIKKILNFTVYYSRLHLKKTSNINFTSFLRFLHVPRIPHTNLHTTLAYSQRNERIAKFASKKLFYGKIH